MEENDPLDPHGDGTIREGDPIFDILMNSGGRGVIGNRRSDGTWDVEIIGDDDEDEDRRTLNRFKGDPDTAVPLTYSRTESEEPSSWWGRAWRWFWQ